MESGARKGDILIRKKCLIIGKKFSIGGHAAIINFPLHWNSKEDNDFSIDATPKDKKAGYSDGVQHMKFLVPPPCGTWNTENHNAQE